MKYLIIPLWEYLILPFFKFVNFLLNLNAGLLAFIGVLVWKLNLTEAKDAVVYSITEWPKEEAWDDSGMLFIGKLFFLLVGNMTLAFITYFLWNLF